MVGFYHRGIKYYVTTFLLLANAQLLAYNAPHIECAFVAYATESYFPILKILLDSHKHFSKKPIIVYGVNADMPFSRDDYPLLLSRRIDITIGSNRFNVWCYKSRIMLESNVKFGIYIDADAIIASPQIDLLFETCKLANPLPLCPIHPNNVMDDKLYRLMHELKVAAKSMHYVHDNVILFSDRCLNFLHEWHRTGLRYASITPEDEKVLNVLLWKYNATQYLMPIEFYWDKINIIPKTNLANSADLFRQFDQTKVISEDFYTHHNQCPLIFHGCKDIKMAHLLLDYIKKQSIN